MDGFRRLGAMQTSAPLQAVSSDPFPASYSDRVRKIGVVNTRNRLITDAISRLLDGPAALRRTIMNRLIVEGDSFEHVMRDDDALEDFIRKAVIGVWHASCSCRMGADDDPMAVTDPQGRREGVPTAARGRRVSVPRKCSFTSQHDTSPVLMTGRGRRRDAG